VLDFFLGRLAFGDVELAADIVGDRTGVSLYGGNVSSDGNTSPFLRWFRFRPARHRSP